MANNYDINYDDKRFTQVESDKQAALSQVDKTYGDMISQSDSYFDKQIEASKEWENKQAQLQQEQTDFAIEKIEQQKEQAQKDYTREQSGAFVDWKKQSDQYGVNAEQMADGGLQNTGFSESSQVSMWNTYQNRIAAARESFVRATLNFDNGIKEAMLANNSALAEIHFKAYQQQLEHGLQGFQYRNDLVRELANKKTEVENTYYGRYQDVLQQINTENALAEQIRQYNESLAEERRQFNETMAYNKSKSSGGGGDPDGVYQVEGGSKLKSYDPTQNSIAKLGYGPLSPSGLAELVGMGEVVITYDKDGNEIFKRTDNKTAAIGKDGQKSLMEAQKKLDKYTMLRL